MLYIHETILKLCNFSLRLPLECTTSLFTNFTHRKNPHITCNCDICIGFYAVINDLKIDVHGMQTQNGKLKSYFELNGYSCSTLGQFVLYWILKLKHELAP